MLQATCGSSLSICWSAQHSSSSATPPRPGMFSSARFRRGAPAQRRVHETRMRQSELRIIADNIAVKQQVEIQCARGVFTLRWRPKRSSIANRASRRVGADDTATSSTTALMKSGWCFRPTGAVRYSEDATMNSVCASPCRQGSPLSPSPPVPQIGAQRDEATLAHFQPSLDALLAMSPSPAGFLLRTRRRRFLGPLSGNQQGFAILMIAFWKSRHHVASSMSISPLSARKARKS